MLNWIIIVVPIMLSIFLLCKYLPIWIMRRKEAQIDKEIKAEIVAISEDEKLTVEQLDPKNWLPSPDDLDDLLDDDC